MNNHTTTNQSNTLPEHLLYKIPQSSQTYNYNYPFLTSFNVKYTSHDIIANLNNWLIYITFLVLSLFILYVVYTVLKAKILSQYKHLNDNILSNDKIDNKHPISKKGNPPELNKQEEEGEQEEEEQQQQQQEDGTTSSNKSIWENIISAIRIFGYLDKNIVKELINNTYTQRVEEGDMIVLNDNLGLIVVLEGSFQVYHKISSTEEQSSSSSSPSYPDMESLLSISLNEDDDPLNMEYIWLKDGLGKFQLLNIIKRGNPLSSLIDILKLFTLNLQPSTSSDGTTNVSPPPTLIARASTPSTIAVIPSISFNQLLFKYPKAASHLIQTILNRLYHVNFQITHSYLGLTNELFQIEKNLNKNHNYKLPFYLIKNVIQKFNSPTNERQSSVPITSNPYPSGEKWVIPTLTSSPPIVDPPRSSTNCNISPKNNSHYPQFHPIYFEDDNNNNNNNNNNTRSKSNEENSDLDNLEEYDDSILKLTLVDIIFKFWGINKDNFVLKPYNNNNNDMIDPYKTRSSSMVTFPIGSYNNTPIPSNTELKILPKSIAISKRNHRRNGNNTDENDSDSTSSSSPSSSRESPLPDISRQLTLKKSLDYRTAKNDFAQCLDIKYYPQGTTIVKQNSDSLGLFYVISGGIDVTISPLPEKNEGKPSKSKEYLIYSVKAGGIAGYLSSLVGYRSFVNLIAHGDCYVAFISNEMLEILYEKYYSINLKIAESLSNNLSLKLWKLDHALEWVHINASKTLFHQGEQANGIYVILNGRLRQYQTVTNTRDDSTNNGKNTMTRIIGELAQGESFGEVEVLTAMNRTSTIVAVRDTELARLPRSLFELLATEHPSIVIRVSRMVVKKLLDLNQSSASGISSSVSTVATMTSPLTSSLIGIGDKYDLNLSSPAKSNTAHHHSYSTPSRLSSQLNSGNVTYRTITILPITNGLPVEAFAMRLVNAFKQVGKNTIGLTQRTTLLHLGRHAFDKLSKLKQSGYFADLEHTYNVVVYIADTAVNSSWTKTCIDQGDCILLLADANSNCKVGEYEDLLLRSKTSARTELILLHGERYVEPGLTHKWLCNRPWVDSHHHIQFEINMMARGSSKNGPLLGTSGVSLLDRITQTELGRRTYNISKLLPDSIKNTVGNVSSKFMRRKRHVYNPIHAHKSDFLRLARLLSGQAIGLVLGGGGARGISHLGVLQALEEQGIPVDIIGGTSIGSFIGGIYAKDYDVVPIYGRIKKFAGRISSLWRMLSDLTWPVTSYTTGHEFNRGVWKTFGDTRIEDFWIQYYCNSTNITESVQEIHSFGYAWRYIRASMSLAGLLPPLEENGSMLLDGGYVDNLPVDEMKARGCKTVFAIDVGSVDDKTPMNYGDSLNGFWIVFNRWNPFSSHPNIPNMAEIQMRLGYVASVNALQRVKHTPGVIYARPPIDDYNTLDFAKFEEIYQVGVHYGRLFIQDLIENGNMPYIPGSKEITEQNKDPASLLYRRNSM